jgi:hypothetical protein
MSDKLVLAIDPGNTETAYVLYNGTTKQILETGKVLNSEMCVHIRRIKGMDSSIEMVIEMVASYGMPVGRSVFDTCVWIGRYIEVWSGNFRLIVRKDVKMHLCNSTKANDSNIRQALMDKWGSTKEASIGTKKSPGPLYGLGNDERAALALAITAAETTSSYELGILKPKLDPNSDETD